MSSFRIKYGRGVGIAVVVGLMAMVPVKFGAAQEAQETQQFVKFACGNVTVKVVPTTGTDPKAVYLCAGNTMTWDANGHSFIVIFRKNSPFQGNQKVFDNNHYQSKPAKNDSVLTVYNYDITVDGEPIDDPQVVGGGGH
jgi:hypothetical protein